MSNSLTEWQRIQKTLNDLVNKTAIVHLIAAEKAKITVHELLTCQAISELKKVPIEHVFKKMALFKESSEYLLYKKEFTY